MVFRWHIEDVRCFVKGFRFRWSPVAPYSVVLGSSVLVGVTESLSILANREIGVPELRQKRTLMVIKSPNVSWGVNGHWRTPQLTLGAHEKVVEEIV
jgi:hypothetical protein